MRSPTITEAPIVVAGPRTWTPDQIAVPGPIVTPGSISAVGWIEMSSRPASRDVLRPAAWTGRAGSTGAQSPRAIDRYPASMTWTDAIASAADTAAAPRPRSAAQKFLTCARMHRTLSYRSPNARHSASALVRNSERCHPMRSAPSLP